MVLSMFTGFSGVGATQVEARTAVNHVKQYRDEQSLDGSYISASKVDEEGIQIPMPMGLSKSSMGFYKDMVEQEVTAYMTDLWYLGLLTVDEYAAFFPVSLDLDRVDYISHQLKQRIGQIREADRLALRKQAEAKLDLKEQFIWDVVAGEDGQDANISFEPIGWTIYEATQNSAPMIACTAKVKWVGEQPVEYVQQSSDELAALMNASGSSAESGTKSIADESPEVQEFLRQMYAEGLTQDRSPYDLSAFENENSGNSSFNLMGDGASITISENKDAAAPAAQEGA